MTSYSHNTLNQLTAIGGSGGVKTLIVRGNTDQPAAVKVKPGTSSTWKNAKMLSGNRFESDIDLATGPNEIDIQAKDGSNNTSNYSYALNLAAASAATPSHDADGNLLGDGVRSYEWDSQSRLTKVTWGAGSNKTTQYKYNPLGQRSERIEKTGTTETSHYYYLYEGIQLVNRYTGGTAAANIDRRFFFQGEQRLTGPSTWTSHYYTRDHLGSIREVMKSDGPLQARYDYDPYGKRSAQYLAANYADGCDLGYTGHITQPSPVPGQTELVLTLFRAYDPDLGRWLSADPIGEEGGVNLYVYVRNNPLNFYDPDGRDAVRRDDGSYSFHVTTANWARANPGTGEWNLNDVFDSIRGRHVNHPDYDKQCATGAQAMTGTYGKDGKWRDAAPRSLNDWFKGPVVSGGKVLPGTMIATGWNRPGGKYGGANGHTGIYMGKINGRHMMFAQNGDGQGRAFTPQEIPPADYFEVRSENPYDKGPSKCTTPPR